MRLCFVIVCLAGIGVGVVHLRKRESIARHEWISLDREYKRLREIAPQQDAEHGRLTNPKQIADRVKRMNINTDRRPVHLAGPADERRARRVTHRMTN